MKSIRTYLALGLLAAVPAVFAQSSVTLYGLADVGIEFANHVPSAKGGSSVVRMQSGNINGSRFGLRGTEDLGGGARAIFVLENGFSITNGTLGQGGRLFGRQAYVGLSDKQYGTLTLGRQKNLIYAYFDVYDALDFSGTYSAYDADNQLANRADNAVRYALQRGGVTFAALYSTGYDSTIANGAQVPGATKVGREYSFALVYQGASPLSVGAVYDQLQGTSIATQSATQQRVVLGANYTLGPTEFYLGYRWLNAHNQAAALSSNVGWGGIRYQFSAPLSFAAGVYHTEFRNTHNGPTSVVLLSSYALSKRTSLYIQAAYAGNTATSNQGIRGVPSDITAGSNQTGVTVGFAQTF